MRSSLFCQAFTFFLPVNVTVRSVTSQQLLLSQWVAGDSVSGGELLPSPPSSISLLQVPRHGQSGLTSWSRWVTGSTPTQGLLYESEDTVSLLSLDPTRSPSQQSSATSTSTTTSSRLLPSTVQVTSRSPPVYPCQYCDISERRCTTLSSE